MNHADFENSPAGRLIPTLYGEKAFLPNPLPASPDLGRLALPLSRAMGAVGELRGACRRLPNPYIVIRPLQRTEALTSSAMEGTHTTDDELLMADIGIQTNPTDTTREVANYITALSEALVACADAPITNRVLRDAHRTLLSGMSGARGGNKLPGQFKVHQNMIGGDSLQTARFIPPPPKETLDTMSALEAYINRPETGEEIPLLDIAMAHYQFEAIHPFADGNGRVGRMLISLMAVKSRLLEMPVLYLSPVIEHRKDEYIDLLYAVSSRGAWIEWLSFFFDVVTESCLATIRTIDRLIALQTDYRSKVRQALNSTNALTLVDMLFETYAVTARDVATRLALTDPGARNLLARLVDLGILTEVRSLYPKAYLAQGVFAVTRAREATPPGPPSSS